MWVDFEATVFSEVSPSSRTRPVGVYSCEGQRGRKGQGGCPGGRVGVVQSSRLASHSGQPCW